MSFRPIVAFFTFTASLILTGCGTSVAQKQETGATGPAGPAGLVYRGSYNSATAYVATDVVTLNGSSYVAIASSTNISPVGSPASALDWSILAVAGAQGPQGATGGVGPQGLPGIPGLQGPMGVPGTTGAAGPQGVAGLAGPTGAQGLTGLPGAPGIPGPAGVQGLIGATGPAGAQGVAGPVGPSGTTGPIGPQGTPGLDGTGNANPWNGKVLATFGDSIFAAFNIPPMVATASGMTLKFNDSVGGRRISQIFSHYPQGVSDGTFTPAGNTLAQDLAGVDLVVIELTTNDTITPKGSYADTADPSAGATIAGSLRNELETIRQANLSATVVVLTPYRMLVKWSQPEFILLRDLMNPSATTTVFR